MTGESPLIDTRRITTTFSAGRTSRGGGSGGTRRKESKLTYDELMVFQGEAEALRTGLASGVKPVPVNIPEQGKLLTLSGALPPSRVSVTLDVKPD